MKYWIFLRDEKWRGKANYCLNECFGNYKQALDRLNKGFRSTLMTFDTAYIVREVSPGLFFFISGHNIMWEEEK